MQVVLCNAAALAVASVFYAWRAYADQQTRRELRLRHRVAYMLWVMAGQVN
jgi:hypothetical protein